MMEREKQIDFFAQSGIISSMPLVLYKSAS